MTGLVSSLNRPGWGGQAIGIIRGRSGGGPDDAFARLKRISQSENVKVILVAERLVDEAVRSAEARRRF